MGSKMRVNDAHDRGGDIWNGLNLGEWRLNLGFWAPEGNA